MRASRRPVALSSLGPVALVVSAFLGCSQERPPPPAPIVASATSASPLVASASASSPTTVPPPAASSAAAPSISPAQRQTFTAALRTAQTHVREKRWAEAVRAFEDALLILPTDGSTLCDLGFVALKAGDPAKAEAANLRALTFVHEPNLRAKVLFNQGLVHESKGQKAEASKLFQESLALRKNATVEKHLREIDKDKVAKEPAREPIPCARAFPTVGALCACLKASAGEGRPTGIADNEIHCDREKPQSQGGDLITVKFGPEVVGERTHLAVAKTDKGLIPIGDLGHDFEPGAFGVHNEATVKTIEETEIEGRRVFLVRSVQDDFDQNMAGLEQYHTVLQLLTFCLPATATTAARCPVQYPTEIHATLSYPDFDEMSAEDKAEQKERRKGAYDRRVTLTHSVEKGVVQIKLVKGSTKDLATGIIGAHKLFLPASPSG